MHAVELTEHTCGTVVNFWTYMKAIAAYAAFEVSADPSFS